jgi:hypothetical protein
MTGHWAALVAIGVISAAGSAIVAAPQAVRPGEMTKAGVWVENRSGSEAIPVNIEAMSQTARPLRVEVIGTPAVALVPSTTVLARVVRQPWEHRLLTIPAGQDATVSLSKASTENWEAVGFQVTPQGSTLVLLKRPM